MKHFVTLILLFLSSLAFVDLGNGTCQCSNCADCTSALNSVNCSYVELTQDVGYTYTYGTCINNPENFSNKVFDCKGHYISFPEGSESCFFVTLNNKL